jgi:TolC family type I secretion outer membrane protein
MSARMLSCQARGVYREVMRHWLVIATLAGAAWLAGTSGSGAQTLQDALVAAYLTNPDLQAQRAALQATDELVPQALSGWRPTLAIDNTLAHTQAEVSSGGSSGNANFSEKGSSLTLNQELYSGGETVANTQRAERLVRVERARLQAIEQNVLLDAVTVYTNMLATQAVLNFAIQNESRLQRQLQATRDRFQVGEVTRTDVAQAEARLSGATSDRIQAEGDLATARADYRRVINQEPGQLVVPPPLKQLPASQAEAHQLAEVGNPNITAAQFNLAAARADVQVAMSALYPRLSIQGELNYTDEPNASLDWQRSAAIGATLRVPLYQGGGEYARVRQTKQTVRQREDDLEASFRSVRNEVTTAWQALETATSRIDSIGAQVHANEVAVEGARQEALVGQRTTLDVLDQESDLFSSQVDFVRARRDQVTASYRLKAAVGELTVAGLSLPVQPYNPEAYYGDVRNRLVGLGPKIDRGRKD